MTTLTTKRWLFVALAIVGLALAATAVSAHGTATTTDDPHPYNGTAEEWESWMERHMSEHMGLGAIQWMDGHMGVTIEETAPGVADGDSEHITGYGMHGDADVHYDGTHSDEVHHDGDDVYGTNHTHDDGVHGNDYGVAGRGHGC